MPAMQEGGDEAIGELAITPSKACCALVHGVPHRPVHEGASSACRPSSSKRLRVQDIRYIWARMSPRRAESFSRRLTLPPRTRSEMSERKENAEEKPCELLVVAFGF